MEFIKILKRRHSDVNFLLFGIKGPDSVAATCLGVNHKLDNFLYRRTWHNKRKTDNESEILSSSSGSSTAGPISYIPLGKSFNPSLWPKDHRIIVIPLPQQ